MKSLILMLMYMYDNFSRSFLMIVLLIFYLYLIRKINILMLSARRIELLPRVYYVE